jgi:SAM-dependent methyltransferase
MSNLFISAERKLSIIKNTGIQYIPGHIEPLVDLIIDKYLPGDNGDLLDLGGGGLRFAIPVASLNRKIIVVDLDKTALDIDLIFSKMKENGFADFFDLNLLKKNILTVVDDVFNFIETTKVSYSLITLFRVIHFFNENEVDHLFNLLSKRLRKDGKLVVSAFSQYNDDNTTQNEIFSNSKPFLRNVFYRKFIENNNTEKIQKEQNLGPLVHLFSEDYLKVYGEKHHLKLITGNLPSTRIVRGYIFTK